MINIFTTDDWILIKLDNNIIFSGHSIKPLDLKFILEYFSTSVNYTEISQKEMETLSV